jgi:putative membrane protein
MSALPAPGAAPLLTQWAWQPLALAAIVVLGVWYARGVVQVRGSGRRWPVGRSVTFAGGLVVAAWTTCGFLQAYVSSLFWVWTTQQLALLLVVPLLLLGGGPLQLARLRSGDRGLIARFLRSPVARVVGNPLVGPALVPLLSVVLFFGPLPGWAIQTPALGWVLDLVIVAVGGLIVLPLIGLDDSASSLAVGLSLAIGSFELVLDAVPGIVLRLHNTVATNYFAHRTLHAWSTSPINDQRTAGSILWCVSEVIDLPFLLLVYRRWVRADARDAAQIDAVLEAERIARGPSGGTGGADGAPSDVPWWVNDPAMQQRLRRRS